MSPSPKYLDALYSRDDAGDILYRRLEADLKAAGIPLYRHSAPKPVAESGEVYVCWMQASQGWLSDDYHSASVRHPVGVVKIYADCLRDEQGEPLRLDQRNRALALFDFIDPLVNNKTSHEWAEVISCRRDGEPQWIDAPNSESAGLLHVRYEVAHYV